MRGILALAKGDGGRSGMSDREAGTTNPAAKGNGLLVSQEAVIDAGNYLLSHNHYVAVRSAQQGLTSVFGMGTGVTPAVLPPTSFRSLRSIRTGSCEPSLTQVIAENT